MAKLDLEKTENARIFAESIVETVREPLLVLDQNLDVVSANTAFFRKFRVGPAETEGARIYDLGNKQWDIPELRNLLENIIPENEKFENLEIEHEFPDIGRRIMVLNARRIGQEGGRRSLILLAIEDITDRVETRRALEASEALYSGLVEGINSIIIEINAAGEITFFNRFAEKLFGYSRNELMGKNLVGTILPERDSEGNDNTGLIADLFRDPDDFYFNESVGIRKNGREVWFSWSARSVTNPETDEVSILIDGNDITGEREARRQAQDAFNIIHASGNAIIRLDAQKQVRFANRAYAGLLGRRIEEIEGRHLADTGLPENIRVQLDRTIDDAGRRREDQILEIEYGNTYLLIRVEPEYEKDRSVPGSIIFFNDISERKRAEDEVRKLTEIAEERAGQLHAMAMDMIEAEERERKRISDLLHDDLQQILVSVRLQLQAASQNENPASNMENADRLLESVIEKSNRLAHRMSPPVLHQFGLAAALNWLVREMEERFGLGVRLEAEAAHHLGDSPVKIFLFRAAEEILSKIARHSGVKSARVLLTGSDSNMTLSISDSGREFAPEILDYANSQGMWLAILRERAHAIGGSLAVESAPGKGSRFTLTVPLSLPENGKPETIGAATDLHAVTPVDLRPAEKEEDESQ